jgi:hypothetical protein
MHVFLKYEAIKMNVVLITMGLYQNHALSLAQEWLQICYHDSN